jgi:hypothetical protein
MDGLVADISDCESEALRTPDDSPPTGAVEAVTEPHALGIAGGDQGVNDLHGTASSSERTGRDSGLTSVARIYSALQQGKDNYAADRAAAAELENAVPGAAVAAADNRDFVGRAVQYLAGRAGIRQFLDIGPGMPADPGRAVHEIAGPGARVAYADYDPEVVRQIRAAYAGVADILATEGDIRYPSSLTASWDVGSFIDFRQPVAVLLAAVLHFVPDEDHPFQAVRTLIECLAPGSYVVISHVTGDDLSAEAVDRAKEIYNGALVRGTVRSRAAVKRFFTGLEMARPGVADVAAWRPGLLARTPPRKPVLFWAGMGRKPKEARAVA